MISFLKRAVLCLLALPLTCVALPILPAPINISTPGQNAVSPAIAVDPSGNVVAVWLESGIVKSNTANISGSWSSTITTVSGSGASTPYVQIDQTGTATAVWNENGVIKSSSLPLNGSWSTAVDLSGASSSSPQLSIDASGNLVAVWVEGDIVKSSTQLFGGSWSGSADTLSGSGSSSPQVSIGSDGTVIAVWQTLVSSTPTVYAASKAINGSWGSASAISSVGVNSAYPQIAVDPSGNAVSIWYTYDLVASTYSNVTVNSSSFSAGGSWSTPVSLIGTGLMNPINLPLRIVAGSNGRYVAFWGSSSDGLTFSFPWSLFSGGSWTYPKTVTAGNNLANSLDLSTNSNGDIFVIWMQYDPETSSLIIQGTLSDITSTSVTFLNPWTLSMGGNNDYPVVAMNFTAPYLLSASAWVNFDGTNTNIQAGTLAYPVIQPPSNLAVSAGVNDFGVTTQIYNTLSWQASPTDGVRYYLVFRNGITLGSTSQDVLEFIDENRSSGETVVYGVAAVDSLNCQSPTVTIPFTN